MESSISSISSQASMLEQSKAAESDLDVSASRAGEISKL